MVQHCHLLLHKFEKVSTSTHVTWWKEELRVWDRSMPSVCMHGIVNPCECMSSTPCICHIQNKGHHQSISYFPSTADLLHKRAQKSYCFYTHSTNQEVVSSMFMQQVRQYYPGTCNIIVYTLKHVKWVLTPFTTSE